MISFSNLFLRTRNVFPISANDAWRSLTPGSERTTLDCTNVKKADLDLYGVCKAMGYREITRQMTEVQAKVEVQGVSVSCTTSEFYNWRWYFRLGRYI